jgi:hypothetical protein
MSLSSLNEKHGVRMEHACVASVDSHVLETYLLSIPFNKLQLRSFHITAIVQAATAQSMLHLLL